MTSSPCGVATRSASLRHGGQRLAAVDAQLQVAGPGRDRSPPTMRALIGIFAGRLLRRPQPHVLRPDHGDDAIAGVCDVGGRAAASGPRSVRMTRCVAVDADDGRIEQVRAADEVGDEGIGGPLVDLPRRSDLLDAAVRHDDDPIGKSQRLALIVGDVDGRLAQPPLQYRATPCASPGEA